MNALKTLLAVSVVAAASSAHAVVYTITGTQDSTANNQGAFIYQNTTPYGGVLPSSFTANQAVGVSGSLDITGTTISSGSLSVNPYGVLTSLSGPNLSFYAIFDSLASGYTFTGTGAGFVGTGPGISNCTGGGAQGLVCGPAQAGTPPLDYVLTSTGANTYNLVIHLGTQAALTTQTFSLTATAPAVPVPAAAWLFGSGLLGLAGTARRRRNSAAV
jgi:hypothetical protein